MHNAVTFLKMERDYMNLLSITNYLDSFYLLILYNILLNIHIIVLLNIHLTVLLHIHMTVLLHIHITVLLPDHNERW